MLSILIPTYNYNAFPLAEKLVQQAKKADLEFELICIDDGSGGQVNSLNQKINQLENCRFIEETQNRGRSGLRHYLALLATHEWLLFLDADTLPQHDKFLANYKMLILEQHELVFGGIAYENLLPSKEVILRWTYGHRYESTDAASRNKSIYKNIISANFLIKKTVFIEVVSQLPKVGYGLDNYFGALLKASNVPVFHFDNKVYHLGLDSNEAFLKKVELSVDTLLLLQQHPQTIKTDNALLSYYNRLNRYKLTPLTANIFNTLKPYLIKNLLGAKPSVKLLQIYKLGYICSKGNK